MRIVHALLAFTIPVALHAENNPLSVEARRDYQTIKDYVIRSAEKMPEADYSFQPTPEIRSFAQLLGHIADDQYTFCGAVKGEKKASTLEKNPPAKTEMVAALKAAFAFCESSYQAMADTWASEQIKFLGRDRPKIVGLTFNTEHAWEHYGNIVVYMRLKGLVPPSIEKSR
jgi:uncharacterized damage-inducible protein DinB